MSLPRTVSSSTALVPLAEILANLASLLRPLEPARLPVAAAIGGVLTQPLVVERPVPDASIALRPGFAVASSDLVGISAYSPLPLGQMPPFVLSGSVLPDGTDAVLPSDAVDRSGPMVEILASAAPGENVCRRGEDARAGAVLRQAGAPVRARDAMLARLAGIGEADVRRASVAVLQSGPGDLDLEPALRMALGGVAVRPCRSLEDLRSSGADVMLLATDDAGIAQEALRISDQVIAEGVALRPGEAVRVAVLDARPVVIAPARLDAVFAASCCILRPVVEALTAAAPEPVRRRGPLTRKLSSAIGVSEVALLREGYGGLEPLAVGLLGLEALALAEAWLLIAPESEGHQAGEVVEAFPLLG